MPRNPLHVLLNDLIALQSHLQEALGLQLRVPELEAHWDAKDLLSRLESRLASNVAALKQSLAQQGGKTSGMKERLGALTGVAAGWLDRARSAHEVTRDLRDDYAVLSLVIVTYGVLNAAAAARKDAETADLACGHLDELVSTLDELRVVLPDVAMREFEAEAEPS